MKNQSKLLAIFTILLIAIPFLSAENSCTYVDTPEMQISLLNCNIPNTNPLCLAGSVETETIAYGGSWYYDPNGKAFNATTNWQEFIANNCGYGRNVLCNPTTGTLTILTNSIYEVNHDASISMGNNILFESAVAVNGVVQNNTIAHLETSAGMRTEAVGLGRIQAFQGDNISLVYRSLSGSYTGSVYELNFIIKRLGG